MNSIYDIIILGGGPSGLTAAIYTSRAFLKTLVFAGSPPGGQLMWTTEVENFPGFPEGIQGPELIESMRKQAQRFDTEIKDENVARVEKNKDGTLSVISENNETHIAKALIVATGASAKWLNLESEQRLRGRGVSACATCDGFFFKDKVVAVVGAGDAAMEEASFLTKFASKVYVLARGSEESVRASKYMKEKAMSNDKIEFLFNTEVKEVLGDNLMTGVVLFNNKTNEESQLEAQGMFVAIGHTPNTKFLEGLIDLDKMGYAIATRGTVSNVEGIFIAGDVYDYRYRQAITAAGHGCMAALDAERYLAEINNKNG